MGKLKWNLLEKTYKHAIDWNKLNNSNTQRY